MLDHVRYRDGGFSIFELVIIVAILGILSSMAASIFLAYRDKSRIAAAVSTSGAVQSALNSYATDDAMLSYPTAIASYGALTVLANSHGGQLPDEESSLGVTFRQYTPIDITGDSNYESYTMSFRVTGISTTRRGWCVVVSPAARAKCDPL